MINKAYVKKRTGDKVIISVKRDCMCAGKDTCNIKCFSLQNDTLEVTTDNRIGAQPGDFVEVEGKTSAILVYCAIAFILPVFIGLLLYFAARVFTGEGLLPYVVSGAGFVLSVGLVCFLLNRVVKGREDFRITRIL